MKPHDVLTWTTAKPFRPFRIHLNIGRSYDIRHPDKLRVGFDYVNVYFPGEADVPYERLEMLGLQLIERIEPIDSPVAAKH